MDKEIVAFLPCRLGSERVKAKNTRPFAGIKGGLTTIKLKQLLNCKSIDSIVVSTNDPDVMDICRELVRDSDKPVDIRERPDHLTGSSASTDELIAHVPEIIKTGIVLWTHVTSPFTNEKVYEKAIAKFREVAAEGYDSLMSVTKLQTFIWNKQGAVNFNRDVEKWPRTQTLPLWYEVNSAIFISSIDNYILCHDRIGHKPYFFETEGFGAFDIDWEDDFKLAELMWHYEKNR